MSDTARLLIGIDGGQSGTRAAVLEGGEAPARGTAPGFTHRSDNPARQLGTSAVAAIEDAGVHAGTASAATIALGMSGLPRGAAVDAVIEPIAAHLPNSRVIIGPDTVTGHIGALSGESGVVAAVGTGTVIVGAPAAGAIQVVDGWGYLLDDAGSGTWIGRRALQTALRDRDGRAQAPQLRRHLEERLGDLVPFSRTIYEAANPASTLAALAPIVFDAAAAGDETAREIVGRSADRVAQGVHAASAAFAGLFPVAVIGGIAAGDGWTERFRRTLTQLRPHASVVPAHGDGLVGALHLAGHGPGRFSDAVSVYRVDAGTISTISRSTAER